MIIDFHTHVFPDELAPRAMATLRSNVGSDKRYTPVTDGTASGLLQNMRDWGIDYSVVQPVITKRSQVQTTNEWIADICAGSGLIGFGGIFPHTGDYKSDIDFVAGLGLRGLKFHPEYQDFILDDEKMLKIYDYALGRGLILLFHAGFDPGFPPPPKSSPRQFANVLGAMRGGVIVAAHLGGYAQWDEVEEHLAGTELLLDTCMGFEHFSTEQFLRIVEKHGADKILFASDSPWSNAKFEIEQIKALPLPQESIGAILGGNAKRILNKLLE